MSTTPSGPNTRNRLYNHVYDLALGQSSACLSPTTSLIRNVYVG